MQTEGDEKQKEAKEKDKKKNTIFNVNRRAPVNAFLNKIRKIEKKETKISRLDRVKSFMRISVYVYFFSSEGGR